VSHLDAHAATSGATWACRIVIAWTRSRKPSPRAFCHKRYMGSGLAS
jgi:hypothetical protein